MAQYLTVASFVRHDTISFDKFKFQRKEERKKKLRQYRDQYVLYVWKKPIIFNLFVLCKSNDDRFYSIKAFIALKSFILL